MAGAAAAKKCFIPILPITSSLFYFNKESIFLSCNDSYSNNNQHQSTNNMKKGALYLSSGPSGAGKDTLLISTRKKLENEKNEMVNGKESNVKVEFLKRLITRDAALCTDLEIPITVDEFKKAAADGVFALSWYAHATWYGIPKSTLDEGLKQGKRLVANVSRTTINTCLQRYGEEQGHEVYCLLITADDETLKNRLISRGREDKEDVDRRVARAKAADPKGPHVITVNNVGCIKEGTETVTRALKGNLKYSIFLIPKQFSNKEEEMFKMGESFTLPHNKAVELVKDITSSQTLHESKQRSFIKQIFKIQNQFSNISFKMIGTSVPNSITKKIPVFYDDSNNNDDSNENYAMTDNGEQIQMYKFPPNRVTGASLEKLEGGWEVALVLTDGPDKRTWVEISRYPLQSLPLMK